MISIFVAGMLPVHALPAGNGTIAGHISDNATGDPIAGGSVYVFNSGGQPPITFTSASGIAYWWTRTR